MFTASLTSPPPFCPGLGKGSSAVSKQCLPLDRGSWTEPRNFSARALEEGCWVCSGGRVPGPVCAGGGRGGCVVVGDPFAPYVVEVAYRTGQVVVFLGQLKLRAVCQVVGECAHSFGRVGEFLGGCARVGAGLSTGLDKLRAVPKFASCA